ncbi:hypothetical protein HGM15179_021278 [Zosterops borbonicus]|uniref:Uncharacterized protein n=1 Tax=Zosterops borbonicus TaxID=364589 RepID=A0A8K1FU75_9PASS|nr:hypothetical protein HGM15179_021278 [Zosterops borbonicus]
MRVGQVSERPDGSSDVTFPESSPGPGGAPLTCGDEPELGTAAGRLQLMAKLAEALSPALNLASQCLTLSGLFSPQTM